MEKYQRIAFLIDAENVPLTKLKTIIADLSKLGKIGYACAYGDWLNDVLKNTDSPTEKAHRIIQEVYKNKVDSDDDGWLFLKLVNI